MVVARMVLGGAIGEGKLPNGLGMRWGIIVSIRRSGGGGSRRATVG